MPITPRFHLSQTPSQLTIKIHIPHIRVSISTIELIIDGPEVHFYSSPYLLHLTFPGRLIDEESAAASTLTGLSSTPPANAGIGTSTTTNTTQGKQERPESYCGDKEPKAAYDPSNENGMLTVTIYKEEEGLWPDLDLLGKLRMDHTSSLSSTAASNCSTSGQRKIIETIDEDSNNHPSTSEINTSELSGLDDFTLNQEIQSQIKPHYGFLNMFHSVFEAYAREGLSHEMLELPQPDETLNEDRREMRLEMEQDKFIPERYLADLFLSDAPEHEADMIYVEATQMKPHWQQREQQQQQKDGTTSKPSVDIITQQMQAMSTQSQHESDIKTESLNTTSEIIPTNITFTDDESLRLVSTKASIPSLSSIHKDQTRSLLLSLMDILFSYAYDHRTTSGDPSCESSWTIVTLSPTLSWFETYTVPYDGILQVLRWNIRRALTYPYLRNFDFISRLLVHDVLDILMGGRRMILRCLLQIQQIFEQSEFHYLFNKLYINPMIYWIQMLHEDVINFFASDMKRCIIVEGSFEKNTFGFNLDQIERDAFDEISIDDETSDEEESDNSCDDDDDDSTSSSDSSSSSSSSEESASGNDKALLFI